MINQLLIFDMSEKLVGVLCNDNSDKCPFWADTLLEKLDGTCVYDFLAPYNHPTARTYLTVGNKIAFKTEDGSYKMFNIVKLEDSKSLSDNSKRVYCEGYYYELIDNIVTASYIGTDVAGAMGAAISGTRWQVGNVQAGIPLPELTDINDPEFTTNAFTMSPALANIQKVCDKFKVEIEYRITTDNKTVTGRYIDIYSARGNSRGTRLNFERNMQSIKRTVDFSNIKTRMYGKGSTISLNPDGTEIYNDFADAVWTVAGGKPVNKPLGQTYVEIPSAVSKYGVKTGVYSTAEQDIYKLLNATYLNLKSLIEPKMTYDVSFIDLERLTGEKQDKIRLGDTIYVQDKDLDLLVSARVIELKSCLTDMTQTSVTLGNAVNTLPWQTTLTTQVKIVKVTILNGTRSFLFDSAGVNLTAPVEGFSATVFVNGRAEIPDSISWDCGGIFSGNSTASTFTPTVGAFTTTPTFVHATVMVGGVTYEEIIPISVSKQGANGNNGQDGAPGAKAPSINITGNLVFKYLKGQAVPTTTANRLTVISTNLDAPLVHTWKYFNGTVWVALTGSSTYRDISYNSAEWGTNTTMRYQVTVDGINGSATAEVTMTKIYDGSDGTNGTDANLLDWVNDWNGQVITMAGDKIISPKIFSGAVNGGLFTGIGIGRNIIDGTDAQAGIVGYKDSIKNFELKADGTAVFGRTSGRQFIINADGSITTPKISADDIKGGKLTLGGGSTWGDGVLSVLDAYGREAGKWSGDTAEMTTLYVGNLQVMNVPRSTTKNLQSYYVDATSGSDLNDGLTWGTAFKSLERAVAVMPKFIKNTAEIWLKGTFHTHLTLQNYTGGTLNLQFYDSTVLINGSLTVEGCSSKVYVNGNGGKIAFNRGKATANIVTVNNSTFTQLQNLTLAGMTGVTNFGVYASLGSNVRAISLNINNCTGGAAFFTVDVARLFFESCKGSNNLYGVQAQSGGMVIGNGTCPQGTTGTYVDNSGRGFLVSPTSWTATAGTDTASTVSHTVTAYTATATRSYQLMQWRVDDLLYQGAPPGSIGTNYGGYITFPTTIQSDLAGKTIDSIKLTLKRYNGGGKASSVPIHLIEHSETDLQQLFNMGGAPSIGASIGTFSSASWDETVTITLPISFAQHLQSGTAKGLALYTPNDIEMQTDYSFFEGISSYAPVLEIAYK